MAESNVLKENIKKVPARTNLLQLKKKTNTKRKIKQIISKEKYFSEQSSSNFIGMVDFDYSKDDFLCSTRLSLLDDSTAPLNLTGISERSIRPLKSQTLLNSVNFDDVLSSSDDSDHLNNSPQPSSKLCEPKNYVNKVSISPHSNSSNSNKTELYYQTTKHQKLKLPKSDSVKKSPPKHNYNYANPNICTQVFSDLKSQTSFQLENGKNLVIDKKLNQLASFTPNSPEKNLLTPLQKLLINPNKISDSTRLDTSQNSPENLAPDTPDSDLKRSYSVANRFVFGEVVQICDSSPDVSSNSANNVSHLKHNIDDKNRHKAKSNRRLLSKQSSIFETIPIQAVSKTSNSTDLKKQYSVADFTDSYKKPDILFPNQPQSTLKKSVKTSKKRVYKKKQPKPIVFSSDSSFCEDNLNDKSIQKELTSSNPNQSMSLQLNSLSNSESFQKLSSQLEKLFEHKKTAKKSSTLQKTKSSSSKNKKKSRKLKPTTLKLSDISINDSSDEFQNFEKENREKIGSFTTSSLSSPSKNQNVSLQVSMSYDYDQLKNLSVKSKSSNLSPNSDEDPAAKDISLQVSFQSDSLTSLSDSLPVNCSGSNETASHSNTNTRKPSQSDFSDNNKSVHESFADSPVCVNTPHSLLDTSDVAIQASLADSVIDDKSQNELTECHFESSNTTENNLQTSFRNKIKVKKLCSGSFTDPSDHSDNSTQISPCSNYLLRAAEGEPSPYNVTILQPNLTKDQMKTNARSTKIPKPEIDYTKSSSNTGDLSEFISSDESFSPKKFAKTTKKNYSIMNTICKQIQNTSLNSSYKDGVREVRQSSSEDEDDDEALEAFFKQQRESREKHYRLNSLSDRDFINDNSDLISDDDDDNNDLIDEDDDVFYRRVNQREEKNIYRNDSDKENCLLPSIQKDCSFEEFSTPQPNSNRLQEDFLPLNKVTFNTNYQSGSENLFSTPVSQSTCKQTFGKAPHTTGHSLKRYSFLKSLSPDISDNLRDLEARKYVTNFVRNRNKLTEVLFQLFNSSVFDNKLPTDLKIEWNSRLLKTAGFCAYKKYSILSSDERSARIELSTKVCDTAERTRDTLIHELCHAAVWLLYGVNNGHGAYWKQLANKANQIHPELTIIRRCHSFEINHKFIYKCNDCGYRIGRHSKSLNVEKKICGHCRGKFEMFSNKNGTLIKTPAKTPNKFALFVKNNYGSTKHANNKLNHKEVMGLLSEQFSKQTLSSVNSGED